MSCASARQRPRPLVAQKKAGAIMAVGHISIRPVSRKNGHTTSAVAAYQSATTLKDKDGQTHSYRSKEGVSYAKILPARDIDPATLRSREAFWQEVEKAEKRSDSRTGSYAQLSLPHELSQEQRLALAQDVAGQIRDRYRLTAVDLAVHEHGRKKDENGEYIQQAHAHILLPDRDRDGKKIALSQTGKGREEIAAIRRIYEETTNRHLKKAGIDTRISTDTLETQMEQSQQRLAQAEKDAAQARADIAQDRATLDQRQKEQERRDADFAFLEHAAREHKMAKAQSQAAPRQGQKEEDVSAARESEEAAKKIATDQQRRPLKERVATLEKELDSMKKKDQPQEAQKDRFAPESAGGAIAGGIFEGIFGPSSVGQTVKSGEGVQREKAAQEEKRRLAALQAQERLRQSQQKPGQRPATAAQPQAAPQKPTANARMR